MLNKCRTTWREGGRGTDRGQTKHKLGMRQRQRHERRGGNWRERHMYTGRGERRTDGWRGIQDGGGEEEHKTGDTQTRMGWADATAVTGMDWQPCVPRRETNCNLCNEMPYRTLYWGQMSLLSDQKAAYNRPPTSLKDFPLWLLFWYLPFRNWQHTSCRNILLRNISLWPPTLGQAQN